MLNGLRNWTKFHSPGEPMRNFTRSEPFPSQELKATYVDSPDPKTDARKRKSNVKRYYQALVGDKE
jgi:hypothetical protein